MVRNTSFDQHIFRQRNYPTSTPPPEVTAQHTSCKFDPLPAFHLIYERVYQIQRLKLPLNDDNDNDDDYDVVR